MKMKTLFESYVVFVILIESGVNAGIFDDIKKGFKDIVDDLPKHVIKEAVKKYLPSNNQDDGFQRGSCDNTGSSIVVKHLSISPSIIKYGMPYYLSTDVDILRTISAPVEAHISIEVKVDNAYKETCGTFNICHIADVCEYLKQKYANDPSNCPDVLRKLGSNCSCPFAQRNYSVRNKEYYLKKAKGIVVYGSYRLSVRLSSQGRKLGCFTLNFCLEMCT